jgi:MFS family permease
MRKSAIFYGWIVVASGFAVTLTLGETFWSFGVFFKPLETEFGWSRAVVSSIFTSFLLGYALSAVVSGRLADRYSPRPTLFASAVLTGTGMCLCSVADSIGGFRLFFLVIGLGAGATWSVPNTIVQRWFCGHRMAGLAVGIVTTGVGVGALVFAPLIDYFVRAHGWRNAFLIVGLVFPAIISISSLLMRAPPQETAAVPQEGGHSSPAEADAAPTGLRLMYTPAFAGVTFIVSVGVLAFQVISVHLIPRASDVGISPAASAAALGMMGGFSVPGRIVCGLLADRFGWQKLLSVSLLGMALSLVFLVLLNGPWMLYLFVFTYGLFHGMRISGQVGVLAKLFGLRSLGVLIGVSAAISQLAGALAPYAVGLVFDMTGSYSMAFALVILLLLVAAWMAKSFQFRPTL